MGSQRANYQTFESKEHPCQERRDLLFDPTISPIKPNCERANEIRKALGLRLEMNENVGAVSGKMGELYISHAATIASVNFQNDLVETLHGRINELKDRERIRDQKLEDMAFELQETRATLRVVQKETRENTLEIKSKNLIINGIVEKQDEVPITTAVNFLKHIDPSFTAAKIENAYRVGQQPKKGNRGMLIKFKDPVTKQDIMKRKSNLKSSREHNKVYCNEDLPSDTRKHRQNLRIIARRANELGYKNTRVKGNNLFHEGKIYKENELSLLPDELSLENIRTRDVGRGLGFFGRESYLSNHHPARFTMNEHRFLSSEQAFFYYKGIVCGHEKTSRDIKKMMDPGEIKIVGDKIPTCENWEKRKLRVMKSVLTHKYEQNKELRDKLVSTGTQCLLECTKDLYWGTGWEIDSTKWDEPIDYPGENNLGKILENIRENYLPVTASLETVPMKSQNLTSTPMVKAGSKSSKKRKNHNSQSSHSPQSSHPPAKQANILSTSHGDESNQTLACVEMKDVSNGNTSQTPKPSTLTTSQSTGETGVPSIDPVESEKGKLSESQVQEVEEITFSDTMYQSYDAKNVTNKDGSLNIEKIRAWGLPALNTSRLMAITGHGTDEARGNLSKLLSAQNIGESFIDTDPEKVNTVELIARKTLTAARQVKPESEKKQLDKLLENV